MKHQRRASDTQFSKRAWVKYEPLTKSNFDGQKNSPKSNIISKQKLRNKLLSQRANPIPIKETYTQDHIIDIDTNNTFYEKDKNAISFYNNQRSFLLKDNQLIQDSNLNTVKKKSKKAKVQIIGSKKKTHTKGNNSVYMKDFEKLMKERARVDNKSLKRMKVYDNPKLQSKPKICAAPANHVKNLKKSKKNIAESTNKQMYHKRVKSNQIYSVKLLIKADDKYKQIQKVEEKPPSITRPSTKKNNSILLGYNKLVPNAALISKVGSNTYRSENCTPRKLKALYKMNYEATCLALENKDRIYTNNGYKNLQAPVNRTANASVHFSSSSQTSTAKDLKQYKSNKKNGIIASAILSPNKKVNYIENNKKTLCDYQKEKRSPQDDNNLVIVVDDKVDKSNRSDNLLSKYLRKETRVASKSIATKEGISKSSNSKINVIEFPSPTQKNTFTIDTGEFKKHKLKYENFECIIPEKEQKLNALQNMPIKKFIVKNNDESSYRQKLQEEEKKLACKCLSISKSYFNLTFLNFKFTYSSDWIIYSIVFDKPDSKKKKSKTSDDYKTSTKIASEHYRIGKVLGKGAFGKVNLAIHKETGDLVAMKSINKQYLAESTSKNKVMQEVTILKMINHKNIMWLRETFETEKHVIFVLELCPGGDLLNYVRKRRKLNENTAKVIFKQILEALQYLHDKNILHRDIKLDNILLDSKGRVKLGDFGVSKIITSNELIFDQWGTPAYIAPEILLDQGYTGGAIDVWSAGVVLYAMMYGTVPFKAHNMKGKLELKIYEKLN